MAICGDFGGRTATGAACKRAAKDHVSRCPQHAPKSKSAKVLTLMPHDPENPYPIENLSIPARAAWSTYSAVVPEPEYPELYAAILALNGSIRMGAEVAEDADPEDGNTTLQKRRLSAEWVEWKKALKLEERLSANAPKNEIERIRAMR